MISVMCWIGLLLVLPFELLVTPVNSVRGER